MNRLGIVIVVGTLTALLAPPARIQGAKPPADQPATVTTRCAAGVTDCPTSNQPDRIRGDGSAYLAVLNANRELSLQLNTGGGRTIWLDFRDGPACVSGCRRNFDTLFLDDALIQTNVVDASGTEVANGLLSIPVGGRSEARLKIDFTRLNQVGQTVLWAVRFNPESYPGSDHVSVTRTATNAWQIEATGTDRAILVSSIYHQHGSELQEGPFYLPFKMTVISPAP